MFSAIQRASVVVVFVVENDAACPCPTIQSDVVPCCDVTTVTMNILTITCFFLDHLGSHDWLMVIAFVIESVPGTLCWLLAISCSMMKLSDNKLLTHNRFLDHYGTLAGSLRSNGLVRDNVDVFALFVGAKYYPDHKRSAFEFRSHVLATLLYERSAVQLVTFVAQVFILVILHPLPRSFPPLLTKRSIPDPG